MLNIKEYTNESHWNFDRSFRERSLDYTWVLCVIKITVEPRGCQPLERSHFLCSFLLYAADHSTFSKFLSLFSHELCACTQSEHQREMMRVFENNPPCI